MHKHDLCAHHFEHFNIFIQIFECAFAFHDTAAELDENRFAEQLAESRKHALEAADFFRRVDFMLHIEFF